MTCLPPKRKKDCHPLLRPGWGSRIVPRLKPGTIEDKERSKNPGSCHSRLATWFIRKRKQNRLWHVDRHVSRPMWGRLKLFLLLDGRYLPLPCTQCLLMPRKIAQCGNEIVKDKYVWFMSHYFLMCVFECETSYLNSSSSKIVKYDYLLYYEFRMCILYLFLYKDVIYVLYLHN